jgi:deoxyribodipyrimidine photolyase-related protein
MKSRSEITLIFPDQLFEKHPALDITRPIFLVEEYLYFRHQSFHKQRLILLRGAMKAYADFLTSEGFQVLYIESRLLQNRGDLFDLISKKGIEQVHLTEFADEWLRQNLECAAHKFQWKLQFYESPMFLCTEEEIHRLFKGKKRYSMAQFYAYQRKKLNILMEEGSPVGGKYSFDTENRKRLPKGCHIPDLYKPQRNNYVEEATRYVENEFPNAIGNAKTFLYPLTHSDAKKALHDFIKNKLKFFGDYEDAIQKKESFLFHSVLSPLINIGLITPQVVIEEVLSSYDKFNVSLNSLEGFLRQIIGWREFMRACYLLKGNKARSSNYFQHKAPVPIGFWNGTTGIVPVDTTIKRILETGYCHHIERLMVLGNFLLLIETDPNSVYEWFMGFFVDAYDWVMVPNVYSMSQYADQGTITTKPYISGSNYILKMSDYSKGEWVDIWDGLFWRFIEKHKSLFEKNPRTKVLLNLLDKNYDIIKPKIILANEWLSVGGLTSEKTTIFNPKKNL